MFVSVESLYQDLQKHMDKLPTPLSLSTELTRRIGARIYLKNETVLPTGSFKSRPALTGILANLDQAKKTGVVAASSGNFAQAVAYWGSRFGVRTQIVMMKRTSPHKVKQTIHLGGEVVFCENSLDARNETLKNLQAETGAVCLEPFDSQLTLLGDTTLGLELAQQILEKEASVLVPCSGGGLAAGVALALHKFKPAFRIYAVQPEKNNAMKLSLERKEPTSVAPFLSIADALVATRPGKIPFKAFSKFGDGVFQPSEASVLEALRILWKFEGIPAEPGAAVAVASLLDGQLEYRAGEAVVCVITGKNVDPEWSKAQNLT